MPHRPLRILHLTAGSDAGGVSRYIFDLCSAMHEAGHEVTVAGERGAWHWLFEKAPFRWIDVPLKGGVIKLWQAARTLKRHLDDYPPDVLRAHYRRATLVARRLQSNGPQRGLTSLLGGVGGVDPTTTSFVPSSLFRSPPVLYTLHLSHIPISGVRRWLTDFGDHTHAASADARRWLVDVAGVETARISMIPHGVDISRFPRADEATKIAAKAAMGMAPGQTLAAYVGRFDRPKNEEWILDLAAATRAALPEARFVLAGEGPNDELLRTRVAAEGLTGRVSILGHRDPLPVYQAADALLLPSSQEGFSYVCAEAMSVGVAVLRTRTSGTAETVVEGVTGRSVEIDHGAFLRAAADFLAHRAALTRMGIAAADHVRRHLTFDRQLSQTIDLYRSLAMPGHVRKGARGDESGGVGDHSVVGH